MYTPAKVSSPSVFIRDLGLVPMEAYFLAAARSADFCSSVLVAAVINTREGVPV